MMVRLVNGHESCIDPTILPAVATDIVDHTVLLREVNITNQSSAAALVTITDKQTPPLPVVGAMEILPGQTVTLQFGPRYMPNGISWYASVASAVVGYLRWSSAQQ